MKDRDTISESVWGKKRSQTQHYEAIVKLRTPQKLRRVRVTIKLDSHDFQSFGKVELWTGSTWKEIHSLRHGSLLKIGEQSPYRPESFGVEDFADDRRELLRVARQVLA